MPRPWFTKGRVTWWKCPGCSLLFVYPQPGRQALAALYEAAYYAQPSDHSPKHIRYWRDRVRMIETICAPGRVLDVGCGRGEFLMSALERGWQAWGLEVSASAVNAVAPWLQSRVVVGRLEHSPFREQSFDALTYFDVIEHVAEPEKFLASGRQLLTPDGILIITTPDAGCFKARVKRRLWRYFDFDRYLHLYHFNARTLELALSNAGFGVHHWFRRSGTPLFVAARKA